MHKNTRRLLTSIVLVALTGAAIKYAPSLQNPSNAISPSQPVATSAPEGQAAVCRMNGQLPDATCTPGATNPNITQANIYQTVCMSGYTATIRPAVAYTDSLKRTQMNQYGFSDSPRLHEEDHLISLELGGSPTDPKNLWPEPGASPNPKDKIEDFLHRAVCSGRIRLTDAQMRIAKNWTTAEQGI